ncbi:hypothetical protein [Polaromonas sp.]|uniref:hypothetical protein n=1 Tax=Polaromonas sp. TaxID=1869339 RepID=UPI002731646E|nr:hypothetical protein [Polaromonas sp.]
MKYTAAVLSQIFFCVMALLMTVFAGSIHQAPWWLSLYLALTQGLPILGATIVSIWRLHVIAGSSLFKRLSLVRFWSLIVLAVSWVLLILRSALR